MKDKVITVDSLDALNIMMGKLTEFQLIHNELRKDFLSIYKIALENKEESNTGPLGRACIKELFALIEADIYLINQFNPYTGYKDFERFNKKLKNTYSHHATTFGKEDICKNFINNDLNIIEELKLVRDNTTHPKERKLIYVNLETLNRAYEFYEIYTKFVSDMMTNVFVSTTIPNPFKFGK